jgi:hypothetical protein
MTYSVGKTSEGLTYFIARVAPIPKLQIYEYPKSQSSFVPKPMVLALGLVKVIEQGSDDTHFDERYSGRLKDCRS